MTGELILSSYTYNEGRIAINNAFSAQTYFNTLSANTLSLNFQTLTYSSVTTWDCALGSNAMITLTGNVVLVIIGVSNGSSGTIVVKQDGAGGRELIFFGSPGTHKVINGGGGSMILSSSAGSEDILSFLYVNSTFYWNIGYSYN